VLKTGLLNSLLRSLTLGSKFLLLLFLARVVTPAELGVYGLVVVTITVTLYLLGLDFHTYNTREILGAAPPDRPCFVRDQMAFHGLVYAAVLPLTLAVFISGTLPWRCAGWFYLLLVLEHLSQEAYRLLVTFSRSSLANLVLFLRAGVWVYAVVGVGLAAPGAVTLGRVFCAWAVGAAASIALAAATLRRLPWREALEKPVDWNWIRRGVGVSLRLFAATVCLLGVQYADRYFLQHFHGPAAVGVYTFFAQIANTVQIFVYTAVVIVVLPRLVGAWQRGDLALYRCHMRRLALGVLGVIALVSVAAAACFGPALAMVGREVYREQLPAGWVLLAAMALMGAAYIPHLALYARGRDSAIVAASAAACVAGLVLHALLVPAYGPIGAALGTLAAAGVLGGAKLVFLMRNAEGPARTAGQTMTADSTREACRGAIVS